MSHLIGTTMRKALMAFSFAALLVPTFAQQISTDYHHKTDFQQFHTFSIYKLQASNSFGRAATS